MICFDRAAPTRSLLLAAPPCTARLHRRTAEQHHLDTGYIGDMNAAMTMSLCHIDLASGHIQQSIPAGQMFAQGAFEGSASIYCFFLTLSIDIHRITIGRHLYLPLQNKISFMRNYNENNFIFYSVTCLDIKFL